MSGNRAWVLFSTAGLGGLLAYLLVRQAVEPGFTDYWAFMVVQIAGTLAILLAFTLWLAPRGGLSWSTHLIATANTWADALGTAGHLYERHASYDKITHFLAGLAITIAAADILRALDERGALRLTPTARLRLAVSVTLVANLGWEAYEYLGDVVFGSGRHRGALDTAYDLVSDMTGALVAVAMILIMEAAAAGQPSSSRSDPRELPGDRPSQRRLSHP